MIVALASSLEHLAGAAATGRRSTARRRASAAPGSGSGRRSAPSSSSAVRGRLAGHGGLAGRSSTRRRPWSPGSSVAPVVVGGRRATAVVVGASWSGPTPAASATARGSGLAEVVVAVSSRSSAPSCEPWWSPGDGRSLAGRSARRRSGGRMLDGGRGGLAPQHRSQVHLTGDLHQPQRLRPGPSRPAG